MMALSFQPVTLDVTSPDREGLMVFRDGRLLAVLTCLSDIHDELAGRWFVEASFGEIPPGEAPVFETPDGFTNWLSTSH
jgi:hypothetical protein